MWPKRRNMIPSNNVNGMEPGHMISIVKDKKMGYTQWKIKRAKSVRQIHHIIINTTTDNYKYILRHNNTTKWPVKIDDVDLAE